MKVVFYILCVVITWAVYGRKKRPEYQTAFYPFPTGEGYFVHSESSLLSSSVKFSVFR